MVRFQFENSHVYMITLRAQTYHVLCNFKIDLHVFDISPFKKSARKIPIEQNLIGYFIAVKFAETVHQGIGMGMVERLKQTHLQYSRAHLFLKNNVPTVFNLAYTGVSRCI